jgi:putative oxidoreductase
MLVAIVKVHWSKGFWNMQGGIEYSLTLLMIAAALGLAGPGAYSLDAAFGINFPEPYTFLIGFIAMLAILFITIPLGAWIEELFHIPHQVPSSS